jgi:hypothetical protein
MMVEDSLFTFGSPVSHFFCVGTTMIIDVVLMTTWVVMRNADTLVGGLLTDVKKVICVFLVPATYRQEKV